MAWNSSSGTALRGVHTASRSVIDCSGLGNQKGEGTVSIRFLRPSLAPWVAALVALTAAPASSQVATWNQERVTAMAVELSVAVSKLRESVRREPTSGNVASLQSHARMVLLDTLRLLRNESRFLANELQAGAGYAETAPTALRIGVLARDAAEQARRMFMPEPIMDKITAAGSIWQRMQPYYDPDWNKGDARPNP